MTPLELNILLNIYYSPVWQDKNYQKHDLCGWIVAGVITEHEPESPAHHGYELTDLGRAWVNDILAVELPKKVFINAAGKIIE